MFENLRCGGGIASVGLGNCGKKLSLFFGTKLERFIALWSEHCHDSTLR